MYLFLGTYTHNTNHTLKSILAIEKNFVFTFQKWILDKYILVLLQIFTEKIWYNTINYCHNKKKLPLYEKTIKKGIMFGIVVPEVPARWQAPNALPL